MIQTNDNLIELQEESFYSSEITAMGCNSEGNECAIACSNNVNLHAFPDISTVKQALIHRSTLPITHIEFNQNSTYM